MLGNAALNRKAKGIGMNPKNRTRIPTTTQCYEMLKETGTFEHIKEHSETVTRVAKEIAQRLNSAGKNIDIELVVAAALLHDVTKTRSLETGEDHAETGAELIRGKGYVDVSEIVRQHVRLDDEPGNETITEAEIVNYADKRVIDREIVDLKERRDYILKRYADLFDDPGELEKIFKNTEKTEAKIFNAMPYRPTSLKENCG